ncbi:MAG: double-stranded DNA-binding protein [Nitrososphaerales archaeon]
MSDYDPELEIIKGRKLRELKKKVNPEKPKIKSNRDLFIEHLVDRGIEVLVAAESQYPKETAIIVAKLVEIIKNGELQGTISGGALLSLFRSIGLRIRMNTKIRVEEHGRLISLADRLKNKK